MREIGEEEDVSCSCRRKQIQWHLIMQISSSSSLLLLSIMMIINLITNIIVITATNAMCIYCCWFHHAKDVSHAEPSS